jgi:hypothetical protein
MRLRAVLPVLLTGALLLAVAVQASAHPRAVAPVAPDSVVDTLPTTGLTPPAESIETGIAREPVGWLLLLLLVAVGAASGIGRRRAVVLGLLVIVMFLGFESSVHSVHHLGDPGAVHCTVATAAGHMDGTVSVNPVTVTPVDAVVDRLLARTYVARDRRGARLEQQRAPPA